MRRYKFTKTIYLCAAPIVLLLIYVCVLTRRYQLINEYKTKVVQKVPIDLEFIETDPSIKYYILQWSSPKNIPFVYMGVGNQGFVSRNCTYTNCFVTSNRSYLGDYTNFDVIAFHGPEIVQWDLTKLFYRNLPNKRSLNQKYVFASIESSDYYPICSKGFDNFFNWTWTYKLNSDAIWGYMVIRDSKGTVIGPKEEMHWIKQEDMDPVSEDFKKVLKSKKIAAAWFASNCHARSRRENFVKDLIFELNKYNLVIDIYGRCGSLKCDSDEECDYALERDYYFYLSFENSFSEDYVTEKLVRALKNNVVPIVYGGANYTRFVPDEAYLNGRELGVEKLAKKMNELINDPDEYAEYFRWKNHYFYHERHESVETDDYCRFRSMLNDEELVRNVTVYQNFREWWDPLDRC